MTLRDLLCVIVGLLIGLGLCGGLALAVALNDKPGDDA